VEVPRMTALKIDEAQAASEAQAFSQKLLRGLSSLADIGAIDVGPTPKDVVYREDKLVLYRYRPLAGVAATVSTPVLICFALVNRPYMLDLQADRSLVRKLLERGIEVYLIDWGYPDGADRYRSMADYITGYLRNCVAQVAQQSGHERINLLGVCEGGTLSLCYAALFPETLRNLITMVTPVDFHTPDNLLAKWIKHIDIDAVVDATGNVPGEMLNAIFLALMPFRLTHKKYIDLLDDIDDTERVRNFLRMEKWIFDSPDQPGEMFREFVRGFIHENCLKAGMLRLADRPVDLKQITMPVFNIYATQDHLVPPSSSIALQSLVGATDYSTHAFVGGHIGIYVSGTAQREIPGKITDWLRSRDS
jgi:polyhydroxyalkanoate synthase